MVQSKTEQPVINPKKNILWVYISGAMALTIVVLLFLPDTGTGGLIASVYSAMLWCGIFGASLSRYRDKSGWMGFAIGSAAGLVIQMISQFV
jgi:VIT1/CCC1 family predicted Fe2+/Mn2+ transporter